jgi:hypothetical protein
VTAEFKRLWSTPRRASRGGLLDPPTARQRYLREQSLARYRRRPDAYPPGDELLRGELGHVDSFRFIQAKPLPDPSRLVIIGGGNDGDWLVRAIQCADRMQGAMERAHRSGAVIFGMDFANGPDWTARTPWPAPEPAPAAPPHPAIEAAKAKRERRAARRRELAQRLEQRGKA